jgi:hypothetical protein
LTTDILPRDDDEPILFFHVLRAKTALFREHAPDLNDTFEDA